MHKIKLPIAPNCLTSRLCLTAAFLIASHLSFSTSSELDAADADLILINGKVVTIDESIPTAEAIAIKDGKITKVGTTKEVLLEKSNGTKVMDLKGKLIVPGFIESHAHLTGIGTMLMNLDLTQTKSWDEIVDMVRIAADNAKPGEWIIGRGWHQSLWKNKPVPDFDGYPIHDKLSKISPNNPVLLTHRSGHMSFANQRAMLEAGVSRGTIPPEGGEIPRNRDGDPIGVFRETAQGLISRALTKSRSGMSVGDLNREFNKYVETAQRECLKFGVTTFVDAGMSVNDALRMKSLVDRDRLTMRTWIMLRTSNAALKKRDSEHSDAPGLWWKPPRCGRH